MRLTQHDTAAKCNNVNTSLRFRLTVYYNYLFTSNYICKRVNLQTSFLKGIMSHLSKGRHCFCQGQIRKKLFPEYTFTEGFHTFKQRSIIKQWDVLLLNFWPWPFFNRRSNLEEKKLKFCPDHFFFKIKLAQKTSGMYQHYQILECNTMWSQFPSI